MTFPTDVFELFACKKKRNGAVAVFGFKTRTYLVQLITIFYIGEFAFGARVLGAKLKEDPYVDKLPILVYNENRNTTSSRHQHKLS